MSTPSSPHALVALLADDDPGTRSAVRKALASGGEAALTALQAAIEGDDAKLRARARQLLTDLERAAAMSELTALLARPVPPLLGGLLALDAVLGHAKRAEWVRERIDGMGEQVAIVAGDNPDTHGLAASLKAVLGEELDLEGPAEDFHHADHVSISRTLESRRGLPLTLCAIYALVARRAGFIAGLLPFPGQVLLGLGPAEDRRILDPFIGGDEISEAACLARLSMMGAPASRRWLEPASDRSMLIRQLRNLGASMDRHGRAREARRARRLVESLAE